MSEKQFIKTAETGDILLFRGTHTGGTITRALTGGHFDHVGMVLKFNSEDGEELYLLDATADDGVAMNGWDTIRQFIGKGIYKENNLYSECIYRKAQYTSNEQVVKKLEQFLDKTLGNNYSLNVSKLFKK